MSLAETTLSYHMFLNRSAIIIGETNSGKTTIILDILYQLKPFVDQIVVFSKTDSQTHTYSGGMVPSVLVHNRITPELLKDIYDRQANLASVYDKVWRPEVIRGLFSRIINSSNKTLIQTTIDRIRATIAELSTSEEEESKFIVMVCERYIKVIYRAIFNNNAAHLMNAGGLTKDERFSLQYIDLNPNLVLLFDDMTSDLGAIKNDPTLLDFFNQCRHIKTSMIMSIHSDKFLLPNHKKAAFVNIFARESSANAYMNRDTSDLDREAKAKFKLSAKRAFTESNKWQKLMFLTGSGEYYRFTATKQDYFEFCSPTVRRFCEEVKAEPGTLSRQNKFSYAFR